MSSNSKSLETVLRQEWIRFKAALNGVFVLFRSEKHARLHLVAFLGVLILGFLCRLTTSEWTAVLLASGLVLASEALNTAVEKLCDYVQPRHHHEIGKVKDLAAGAVLIASLTALVVGCLVFIPYLKIWLES